MSRQMDNERQHANFEKHKLLKFWLQVARPLQFYPLLPPLTTTLFYRPPLPPPTTTPSYCPSPVLLPLTPFPPPSLLVAVLSGGGAAHHRWLS